MRKVYRTAAQPPPDCIRFMRDSKIQKQNSPRRATKGTKESAAAICTNFNSLFVTFVTFVVELNSLRLGRAVFFVVNFHLKFS